jgi:hypothetical protein
MVEFSVEKAVHPERTIWCKPAVPRPLPHNGAPWQRRDRPTPGLGKAPIARHRRNPYMSRNEAASTSRVVSLDSLPAQ